MLLTSWLASGMRFFAHDAACLHGKLVHLSCIYPLICPFLCSISAFANAFRNPRAHLHVPCPLAQDLREVAELLPLLPSELPLQKADPLNISWWGDASTLFGIGISVGPFWNVWA